MIHRRIARAAQSGAARVSMALLLLAGGLFVAPSWAVNEHTAQAIASYVNVTLPTIARLKPFIDKPAPERAKAFATMGITDNTCDAPVTEAIMAQEHFAEGAGNLCGAMIAWMHNEDIYTCSRVKFSGIDFAHTEPVDPQIAKLHTSEGILSTRLQLQKAAGCATKTVAYWGPKLLGLLDQLSASVTNAGDLQAPSSGAAVPTPKAFENVVFLCHLAYNGDEKTKSAVVDAADDACYAMNYILDHKTLEACRTLDKSITKAVSMGASDPLAGEAKGLSRKLAVRFGSLDCGTVIAAAKVAEDDAKAKQQATATPPPAPPANNPYAARNAIVAAINGEIQSLNNSFEVAGRWFDRGEDYEACGYYQKVLGSYRTLEGLYADLNRETGDSEYAATSREMKLEQGNMLEAYGDMCVEAERRLY